MAKCRSPNLAPKLLVGETLSRGIGRSGNVDNHINQLSLHLGQCADAYGRILKTIIRHPKSLKLAWFHRVERHIGPGEHSVAIAGIISLIDLFVKHKCGIVVECPQGSSFWPDHLASHFIEKDFALCATTGRTIAER